jgi:hypothetical protein
MASRASGFLAVFRAASEAARCAAPLDRELGAETDARSITATAHTSVKQLRR